MIDTKLLRQKILDLAIKGKLVPQDTTDEPASVLLERIRSEKKGLVNQGKIKKANRLQYLSLCRRHSHNADYRKLKAI